MKDSAEGKPDDKIEKIGAGKIRYQHGEFY